MIPYSELDESIMNFIKVLTRNLALVTVRRPAPPPVQNPEEISSWDNVAPGQKHSDMVDIDLDDVKPPEYIYYPDQKDEDATTLDENEQHEDHEEGNHEEEDKQVDIDPTQGLHFFWEVI